MWYIFFFTDYPSITKVKSLKSVCRGDVRSVDDTEVSSEAYAPLKTSYHMVRACCASLNQTNAR